MINFRFDITLLHHFLIHLAFVLFLSPVFSAVIEALNDAYDWLCVRLFEDVEFGVPGISTMAFSSMKYIKISVAGLFVCFGFSMGWNLGTEIYQSWAHQFNPNNFFGIGDFTVGSAGAFLGGLFWYRKLRE